jgi:hypothetical protein
MLSADPTDVPPNFDTIIVFFLKLNCVLNFIDPLILLEYKISVDVVIYMINPKGW